MGTDSADSQRSMTTKQKHGYHPLQHEPAFPDDKSKVDAGFSYVLALPPDSERPAILSDADLYPCFCAVIFPYTKRGDEEMMDISSSPLFPL